MLFSGLETALENHDGSTVVVQPSGMAGDSVWVTAPRLSVAGGMRLRGRLMTADGEPWVVSLLVDEADYYNHDLARVRLRAEQVTPDDSRRRNPRVPSGGMAWLAAVNCQHVVDGDRVDGTMVDLSVDGVAFATNRVLRPATGCSSTAGSSPSTSTPTCGCRRCASPGAAGRLIVGCSFIEIDDDNRARVERLAARDPRPAPARSQAVDFARLRVMALPDEDEPGGGWRRRFKKL